MSSQQDFPRGESAGKYDPSAAGRGLRHRCPFCRGMMVGRMTDPSYTAYDRYECTMCPTVITFPAER